MQHPLARAAFAVVLVVTIAAAQARLPHDPVGDTDGVVPEPALVKLVTIGFDGLASDWYWVRAIQVVGSEAGPRGRNRELAALIDLVTELNPWVSHAYRFAAVWLIDDEQAVRDANALLRRGIEHHPDDWRQYFHLGFNHFFFLGEVEPAVEALEPAIDLEGAPSYLRRLVARLKSQTGGLEVAAAFLQELVQQAPDDWTRGEYLHALEEVETERRTRFLDQAREAFRERHGRDIATVDELVSVHPPVLRALPPDIHGEGWELADDGRIVSVHYGYRYEVKIDAMNRILIDEFKERSKEGEEE